MVRDVHILIMVWIFKTRYTFTGDFPDGPKVKTSPSIARGASSTPGQRSHMPQGQKTKTKQNIKQKQYCNKFRFNKDFFKRYFYNSCINIWTQKPLYKHPWGPDVYSMEHSETVWLSALAPINRTYIKIEVQMSYMFTVFH